MTSTRYALSFLAGWSLAATLGCARGVDPGSDAMEGEAIATDVTGMMDVSGCTADRDCATGTLHVCDVASHRCVACSPAHDTCANGTVCDATSFTCRPGCHAENDCHPAAGDGGNSDASLMLLPDGAIPPLGNNHCDTTNDRCVQCVTDAHCPVGSICTNNVCVGGCDATHNCPSGLSCCSGLCLDTLSDARACGACGRACTGSTNACCGGHCQSTTDDLANCGACGHMCMLANATPACTASLCAVATCATGYEDLDHNPMNGCECHVGGAASTCAASVAVPNLAVGASAALSGAFAGTTDQWFQVTFAPGGQPQINLTTNPGGVTFDVTTTCDPANALTCPDRPANATGITAYEFLLTPVPHTTANVAAPTVAYVHAHVPAAMAGCNGFVITVSN